MALRRKEHNRTANSTFQVCRAGVEARQSPRVHPREHSSKSSAKYLMNGVMVEFICRKGDKLTTRPRIAAGTLCLRSAILKMVWTPFADQLCMLWRLEGYQTTAFLLLFFLSDPVAWQHTCYSQKARWISNSSWITYKGMTHKMGGKINLASCKGWIFPPSNINGGSSIYIQNFRLLTHTIE